MNSPEQDERQQEAERYFRRNLGLIAAGELVWNVGLASIAVGPIITVVLSRLGASKMVIGLAPVAQRVGGALWQMPAAHLTSRLHARKNAFTILRTWPGLVWVAAGLLALHWGEHRPRALIWALLLLLGVYWSGVSLFAPIWPHLLSRFFGDRRRGLAVGWVASLGACGGVVGGMYAVYALGLRAFPANFAHLFLVAGVSMVLSSPLYFFAHETVPTRERPPRPARLWQTVAELWRGDRRLQRFVFVRSIFEFGLAVSAFFAVYAVEKFHLSDQAAGSFTLALCLGAGLILPVMGRLGDRRGYRRVMGWGMIALLGATSLCLLAWATPLMYVVFFLLGIAMGTDYLALINFLVEMCQDQKRTYYSAVAATFVLPVRLAAPLLWGWLGDVTSLYWAFLGGLAVQILSLSMFLALVDDPRRPGERILRWPRFAQWPRFR